jgi:hypothetical protein
MKHITNNHADRYRAAVRDEKAAEKAANALATAREKIVEAAGREISPELARELTATDEALRPTFARLFELMQQAHARAQAIASAAVSETEDGGPCYDGEWEEDTDRAPLDGDGDEPLFIGSFIDGLSGRDTERVPPPDGAEVGS